jgi:hypothetical protein
MYSPLKLWKDACQIGVDARHVVAMRLAKISTGGSGAVAESRRMVSEKVAAAAAAQTAAAAAQTAAAGALASGKGIGAATQAAIAPVKRTVRANRRRLTISRWIDSGITRLRKLAKLR